jgi:hypothetical protein
VNSAAEEIANLPEGGFLYEPRSLWSIETAEVTALEQLVQFQREHFLNGEPYPITLNRVAVSGIAYGFRRTPTTLAATPPWQSTGAINSSAKLSVTPPFRQHYSREPITLNSMAPIPTGQPRAKNVGTTVPSSLWGVSVLNFDQHIMLPRLGTIHWDLSGAPGYAEGVLLANRVNTTMLFQEEGGLFAGNARSFEIGRSEPFVSSGLRQPVLSGTFPTAAGRQQTQERWPFMPDAFTPVSEGNTPRYWDTAGAFNAQEFDKQEMTRAGSSKLTGMRVHLNQRDMDDALGAIVPGVPIEQLAMRVATRVRTVNAGTQRWWWRPGAPLGLVLDTITPAMVYRLPFPITLEPGDTLDVELQVPGVPGELPEDPNEKLFNVGISFNGWAAIEG